jgi:valyl-tRNA synthetase
VHQQSGPEGGISRDLDRVSRRPPGDHSRRAPEALDAFEHAAALDVVERFFWSRFTDSYVEW